jgi:hypothetical protein
LKAVSSAWKNSTRRAMAMTSGKCCKVQARPGAVGLPALRPVRRTCRFDRWLEGNAAGRDPLFYSVIDRASGQVQGILS